MTASDVSCLVLMVIYCTTPTVSNVIECFGQVYYGVSCCNTLKRACNVV